MIAGIRALTALNYSCKVSKGDSIVIINAAHDDQFLLLQFALIYQLLVFATASSDDELLLLSSYPSIRMFCWLLFSQYHLIYWLLTLILVDLIFNDGEFDIQIVWSIRRRRIFMKWSTTRLRDLAWIALWNQLMSLPLLLLILFPSFSSNF